MTQISGVPDELHGYTAATTGSTFLLSSAAATALAAITAFNDANAGSDVPGAIDDVATPVDEEADVLLDHDRIPAAFADALLALDADGQADTLGRYDIDDRYGAFVASLVAARVERPWADDDMVFTDALQRFDAGFAETFAEVRAGDPTASTDAIWDAAVGEQATKDAEALERAMREGVGAEGTGQDAGYVGLAALMDSIGSRSGALGGYAEQLYIDHLGPDGVSDTLEYIETLAYVDAADGEIDGPDLRDDLLIPFATGFAVAAASPRATPLVEHFSELDYDQLRARQAAMLLSGAPQPAEFLVPVANALLVESPGTVDPRIGATAIGDNGRGALIFGPDGPGDITVVAVEALGANPAASEQFAAMGEDQVRALVFGANAVDDYPYGDRTRFVEAAGDVIEHAVITEGTLGTGDQRTRTDEILIDVVTVADGDVPDALKDRLAAVSASSMGRLQDFVVGGGDLESEVPDYLENEVQDYFAELSHSERAVELLTLGAIDQLAAEGGAAIDVYAGLDHDAPGNVFDLDLLLRDGLSDSRQLLGTLGAAFNDADVDRDAQHASLIGALNWVADEASGYIPGGKLVGLAAGEIIDRGVEAFSDATAPSAPDESIEFVEQVGPST